MKVMNDLSDLKLTELKNYAKNLEIPNISKYKKDELIEVIQKKENEKNAEKNEVSSTVEGILEVLEDGYGFLRSHNYLSGTDDIFVSPTFIRKFNLKTGDMVRTPAAHIT